MGMSLLFSAWIFYRATGAAFNPLSILSIHLSQLSSWLTQFIHLDFRNVSFALLLIGVISPTQFALYAVAQLVGSIGNSRLCPIILKKKQEIVNDSLST